MPFTFKISVRLALMKASRVSTAAVALAACELPGRRVTDPSGSTAVVQVVTSPDTVTLDPYQATQFLAFGRTQSGDSVPVVVQWSASGGTLTAGGLYTADTAAGDYEVTARATGSPVSGSSRVRNRGLLYQVELTPPTASVVVAGTRQFAAYGRKRNGDSVAVSVIYTATGGTISPTGTYTAGSSAGAFRVIATQSGGTLADTAAVNVTGVPVASVTLSPTTANVVVGQAQQLIATPRDSVGNPLSGRLLAWSSTNPAVATVNGSGVVTGVAAGSAMVTAVCEGQGAQTTITVTAVPVATVTVIPGTASVQVGQTVQLIATLRDAAGNPLSGRVVNWTSSNTAVATVNGGGLVTGGAAGAATITAASESMSGTAAVTVTALPSAPAAVANLSVAGVTANSVTLSFTEVSDGAGQPASYLVRWAVGALSWLAATDVAQGSCAVPLGGTAIGATRSCTVLGLAPSTGYQFQLVAFRGTLNVDAVFGALSNIANGTTGASTAPVASVTVSPATASVAVGGMEQFAATLRDASGNALTGRTVTWGSSSTLVATVNGSGLATAVAAGSATITATSEGKSGTAAITVTAAPGGGVVLFQEGFEDNAFAARGWYDNTAPATTTAQHIPGSTRALEMHFQAGATTPVAGGAVRRLFSATPTLYVSYWVKYSANWVGSGRAYHPHEFLIMSDQDGDWDGLSNGWLVSYIEHNYQNGGIPRLAIQDNKAINTSRGALPVNLTGVTENRSVAGCNGVVETNVVTTCFNMPPWYNDKELSAPQVWFKPNPGAGYKGDWNHVEVYLQLNSVVGGIGVADGVMQYWFNGALAIDRHDILFRTGARPTIKFRQFVIAPYIGDGSPVDQYMWVDDLTVATQKP